MVRQSQVGDDVRARASRLLPSLADQWPLKEYSRRAEAALIAFYGSQTLSDPKKVTNMSDLAGLRGIYTLWQRVPRAIAPGSQWAIDMLTRQRGYGKSTDKEFTMHLSPVGEPLPPDIPRDPELKPALPMMLWNPQLGEAVMTTCSAILRTAVNAMWERHKSFGEASEGLQPIVTFGEPREVEAAKRTFLAPQITISGWVERDEIPPFAMQPPIVKLPPRLDAQIGFSALLATGTNRRAKRQKPADLADDLDDEIPV